MHDLVIRGGTVVDGTGADRRTADIAVDNGRITAVDRDVGPGDRTIDADGLLVLPGWVDIHTHYDGQATWDSYLTPSSWHGVTTTVFGNCGVGFAPVRQGTEPYLINLMEGVEDIPGTVLAEGIDFAWETFPEYMDVLAKRPRVMDIGAQMPHGALRFYVMGERGADHAARPTADEIARMGALLEEALDAGALGFTTSRTVKHRAADGRPTPSLSAAEPELAGLADAMARAGAGVIECNTDFDDGEFEILRAAAARAGRPLSLLLLQLHYVPDRWRRTLNQIQAANRDGVTVYGQVGCRPIGVLMGWETSRHPFKKHPAVTALSDMSTDELVSRLRNDANLRQRLIDERPNDPESQWVANILADSYLLDDRPDYEPDPARSIGARAQADGRDIWSVALDLMLADDGRQLIMHPFENYAHGDLEVVRELLTAEHTVCGLGDAGAHVGIICDASYPTFLVAHWARDRKRGDKLRLEFLVAKQTRDSARSYGLLDRGVLAPGYKADINVVDFDALGVGKPELVYDLPAGGKRFIQRASGYRHTFVSGIEVARDGDHTGELPGQLIRGAQPAPRVDA